jgi:hypothetical protein
LHLIERAQGTLGVLPSRLFPRAVLPHVLRASLGLQWHGFTPVHGFTPAIVNPVYAVYKP